MKTRITLLLFLIAFLLLTTGASALSAPRYQIETGTSSGGSYQLTSFWVQTGGIAAGGAYRLLGPSASNLQGSSCCCTYLPCVFRNY